MKSDKNKQARALAKQWDKAGPELEAFRKKELAEFDHAKHWQLIDGLLSSGVKAGADTDSSGMVEMQRIFMKASRKQGLLPSAVREDRAAFGSELPKGARDRLNASTDAPASLYHVGNTAILERPLTAFFCSVRCPGNLLDRTFDLAQKWRAESRAVIGGFHSPVEKEVLSIMLRSTVPACIVLARSLPKRIPAEFRRPLADGRLLLLSPFGSATDRATVETAEKRNHIAASLAERVFVAYAAPGSKTEAFCRSIAGSGKACLTFDDPRTANLREMGFDA